MEPTPLGPEPLGPEPLGPPPGPEPLVLLPGTLCDERVWAPVRERLGRPAEVIPLTGAATAEAMAAAVLGRTPGRFALAGFSLGGIVALEMVAQAPDRVTRLALIDSNAHPDPPDNQARRHAGARRARETGLAAHVRDDLAPHYFGAPHEVGAALVAAMADGHGPDAYADQCGVAATRADSRPRLGAIAVPTLVLHGAEDRLCPPAAQAAMAEAIPGARLVTVPGAGHFALIEDPDAVASALRDWLSTPTRTA